VDNFRQNLSLHSGETEAALLGALLLRPEFFDQVQGMLSKWPSPFEELFHTDVWDAMVEAGRSGQVVDAVAVLEAMKAAGKGDPSKLSDLTGKCPSGGRCLYYAEQVMQYQIFRQAARACYGFMDHETSSPNESVLALAQEANTLAKASITDSTVPVPAKVSMPAALEYLREVESGKHKPKSWAGIKCLDRLIQGFEAGDVVIVAGRPGMGKTALAVNIASNNLRQDVPVLFFSFEMTERQILTRLIGCWGRVSVNNLHGHYGKETIERVEECAQELAQKPFYVAQAMKPTLESVEGVLDQHRAKYGPPGLVVVDYLQLMGTMRKSDNRNQEISYISRGLKTLAMRMEVPIMVLSQLRRPGQGDTMKNPQLHHLRDSGAIEADADAVVLIGFETFKERGTEMILNLNVAKNRHASAGICQVKFKQAIQHIQDLTWVEKDEKPEPAAEAEVPALEEELPF